MLAAAGYRVIVPYLRGYGTTRFLSNETVRNGQQSALAVDIIALMDALGDPEAIDRRLRLGRAHGRHHRGALAGAVQGAGLGQRLPDRQPGGQQGAAAAARRSLHWWYQFYFATEPRPGRLRGVPRTTSPGSSGRLASPKWNFDDATFDAQRRGLRQSGPRQHRHPQLPLAARPGRRASGSTTSWSSSSPQAPIIRVPTITMEGDANGAPHPEPAAYAGKFTGRYAHRLITGGIGHNLPAGGAARLRPGRHRRRRLSPCIREEPCSPAAARAACSPPELLAAGCLPAVRGAAQTARRAPAPNSPASTAG